MMVMRVVDVEEGKGSKGNGDGDQSGRQVTAMATKRAMVTGMRVASKQQGQ